MVTDVVSRGAPQRVPIPTLKFLPIRPGSSPPYPLLSHSFMALYRLELTTSKPYDSYIARCSSFHP